MTLNEALGCHSRASACRLPAFGKQRGREEGQGRVGRREDKKDCAKQLFSTVVGRWRSVACRTGGEIRYFRWVTAA